jgi:hypothetical protein
MNNGHFKPQPYMLPFKNGLALQQRGFRAALFSGSLQQESSHRCSAGGDGRGHAGVVLLRVRLRVRDLGEGQAAAADVLQRHRACEVQAKIIANGIYSGSACTRKGNVSYCYLLHSGAPEHASSMHARS